MSLWWSNTREEANVGPVLQRALPCGHNNGSHGEKDKASRSLDLVGHPGCSVSVTVHSSARRPTRQNRVHVVRPMEHSVPILSREENGPKAPARTTSVRKSPSRPQYTSQQPTVYSLHKYKWSDEQTNRTAGEPRSHSLSRASIIHFTLEE